ncbi:cation-translocating P-type ATPase [Dongia sp.]|uniref:cation-translocating P-type ATPase n=1 Tax=Dongia sp. TaxID=1977262 RepID=UPI0035B2561C
MADRNKTIAGQGWRGLSESEAALRHRRDGPNELPRGQRRSILAVLVGVLKEPMLLLLLAGGAIYFLIGDAAEATLLLLFGTFSVLVSLIQESRTERVLESLRDLSSPRALVIRDGMQMRIPGRDVVCGDFIILAEGDRVPADICLLEARNLSADESLLTGESVPVRKCSGNPGDAMQGLRPGGDDLPVAFSGTLVVRGSGMGEVIAIGAKTEIGKIGASLLSLRPETPRLQAQTARLVRIFGAIAAICSLVVLVYYGLRWKEWLDGVLAGITLGMSLIPEEFPVVLTVFTAMGAWRISRAHVLTRKAAAIETLGAATVLCTDKTGTLTENRMSIAELRPWKGAGIAIGAGIRLPVDCYDLLATGIAASAVLPSDPIDRAFHAMSDQLPATTGRQFVREYGLQPDLLAMTNVWQEASADGKGLIAAKGAPETIGALSGLNADELDMLRQNVDEMGREGMRVLGIARARGDLGALPGSQLGFNYQFIGLVGLRDPLRTDVPAAVAQCRSAGIRVVMMTGDYPATAGAIAAAAGIDTAGLITGDELERMDEAALDAQIGHTGIFARIMPQQKLRLVEAFKRRGDVVAMTGDGVNDAPALRAAHIGIAMGGRGTDVAREAASIVLLRDDFSSVVAAIRLGRRIYDNLRKAMAFIVAVHVPIAGLALLSLVFGWPMLFGPIHIAFLEMVIDPVCTLVFEAEREEENVMRRPPRNPRTSLFSVNLLGWGFVQGAITLLVTGGLLLYGWHNGVAEDDSRALVFTALMACLATLIIVDRSFSTSLRAAIMRRNLPLGIVLSIVALFIVSIHSFSLSRELFRFGTLDGGDIALIAGASLLLCILLETTKKLFTRRAD